MAWDPWQRLTRPGRRGSGMRLRLMKLELSQGAECVAKSGVGLCRRCLEGGWDGDGMHSLMSCGSAAC